MIKRVLFTSMLALFLGATSQAQNNPFPQPCAGPCGGGVCPLGPCCGYGDPDGRNDSCPIKKDDKKGKKGDVKKDDSGDDSKKDSGSEHGADRG